MPGFATDLGHGDPGAGSRIGIHASLSVSAIAFLLVLAWLMVRTSKAR